jgi:hypothetical protein
MDNPYADTSKAWANPELAKAWAKGAAIARSRHGSRSANPYFDAGMKEAWNQGFDAVKMTKSKSRFI